MIICDTYANINKPTHYNDHIDHGGIRKPSDPDKIKIKKGEMNSTF